MTKGIRTSTWWRGMAIVLVVGGLLLPVKAQAVAPFDPNDQRFYSRLTIGLLHSGKSAADVMDYVVNLRLCALQIQNDQTTIQECMKPYTAKLGVSLSQAFDYEGLIGYFSVYEGFTKTTGGMVVETTHGTTGTRTDSLTGVKAKFDFYPSDGDWDFDYSTPTDFGSGYLIWVNDCMLVGKFVSQKLTNGNGNYNSGVVVLRRCGF